MTNPMTYILIDATTRINEIPNIILANPELSKTFNIEEINKLVDKLGESVQSVYNKLDDVLDRRMFQEILQDLMSRNNDNAIKTFNNTNSVASWTQVAKSLKNTLNTMAETGEYASYNTLMPEDQKLIKPYWDLFEKYTDIIKEYEYDIERQGLYEWKLRLFKLSTGLEANIAVLCFVNTIITDNRMACINRACEWHKDCLKIAKEKVSEKNYKKFEDAINNAFRKGVIEILKHPQSIYINYRTLKHIENTPSLDRRKFKTPTLSRR
jgi:hypothetical protein